MTMVHHLPALQVLLPMMMAPLIVILKGRFWPWFVATGISLGSFIMAACLVWQVRSQGVLTYEMGGWPVPFGIGLHIDHLSVLLLLVISGASSLALLQGKSNIDVEVQSRPPSLFYTAWLLVLAGLMGMVVTGDAFNVFVFMEISSLATYVLVAAGPKKQALTSVFKYIIMGSIGAMFYLTGVGLIYIMTGTLNMADMAARLANVTDVAPVLAAGGFITIGLLLKAAIFPMHSWMPGAYTFAPGAVSVFLAACSTKVALYILLRFDLGIFQPGIEGHGIQFAGFLLPLALMAVIAGSVLAIFENNLKKILAFSSVAQLGYIILGASILSVSGVSAGLLHLFNHALMKAALFMAVGCMVYRLGSVYLGDIAGAGRRMPWTAAAFTLSGLSLVGVPLTAGFISKWYLILALLQEGGVKAGVLVTLVLVSSLLAVIYVWRIIEALYFKPAPEKVETVREAPWYLLVPVWFAVGLNFYFGLDTDLSFGLAAQAATSLLGAGS